MFTGQARWHSPHSVQRPARCRAWMTWNCNFSRTLPSWVVQCGSRLSAMQWSRHTHMGHAVAAGVAAQAAVHLGTPEAAPLFRGHGVQGFETGGASGVGPAGAEALPPPRRPAGARGCRRCDTFCHHVGQLEADRGIASKGQSVAFHRHRRRGHVGAGSAFGGLHGLAHALHVHHALAGHAEHPHVVGFHQLFLQQLDDERLSHPFTTTPTLRFLNCGR